MISENDIRLVGIRLATPSALALLITLCSGCYLHSFKTMDSRNETQDRISVDSNRMLASLKPQALVRAKEPRKLPDFRVQRNREVQSELDKYKLYGRKLLVESYERRSPYESMVREVLADEGVPRALINVALVESRYKSSARSKAGAVGMWQFIASTARHYGLKVGRGEDQRKDPVLSTIAAARYLRDLYEQFDDWNLALAAYNAGPGRVRSAMRRGESSDFWVLSRKRLLPPETRKYVPKIQAAVIIDRAPVKNGFVELATLKRRRS